MSRRTTKAVSAVLTVALLLAVWWLQSRDEDRPDRGRDVPSRAAGPTPSQAPSQASSPSPRATGSPDAAPRGMPARDADGISYVDLAELPVEAARTVDLIHRGGPFPYPGKDGSTFGNFEGVLPDRARGYYAEYTVPTPGLDHRGARRIIAGDGGELYWTEDHYESFERIWE